MRFHRDRSRLGWCRVQGHFRLVGCHVINGGLQSGELLVLPHGDRLAGVVDDECSLIQYDWSWGTAKVEWQGLLVARLRADSAPGRVVKIPRSHLGTRPI